MRAEVILECTYCRKKIAIAKYNGINWTPVERHFDFAELHKHKNMLKEDDEDCWDEYFIIKYIEDSEGNRIDRKDQRIAEWANADPTRTVIVGNPYAVER